MLIKNNKTYDVLKEIALTVLPASSVLYLALAGLWGLPYPQQVSGTIMAIACIKQTVQRSTRRRFEVNKARLKWWVLFLCTFI